MVDRERTDACNAELYDIHVMAQSSQNSPGSISGQSLQYLSDAESDTPMLVAGTLSIPAISPGGPSQARTSIDENRVIIRKAKIVTARIDINVTYFSSYRVL